MDCSEQANKKVIQRSVDHDVFQEGFNAMEIKLGLQFD